MPIDSNFFDFNNYSFNPELSESIGSGYNSKSNQRIPRSIFKQNGNVGTQLMGDSYSRLFLLDNIEKVNQLTKADLNISFKNTAYSANAALSMSTSSFLSSRSLTVAFEYFAVSSRKFFQDNTDKSREYLEFLNSIKSHKTGVKPFDFYSRFGDYMVSTIYFGTRVIIFLNLKTEDEVEKNDILLSIGGSYKGVAVSAAISASLQKTYEKVRSSKAIDATMVCSGKYDKIAANKLLAHINSGGVTVQDLSVLVQQFLDSSTSMTIPEKPIFSTLTSMSVLITEPAIPKLEEYREAVLPLWSRIQQLNWLIGTVNGIHRGDDPRRFGMSQEQLKDLLRARKIWESIRDNMEKKFLDIPNCLKKGTSARCYDDSLPDDTPEFSLIPAFPSYVIDTDINDKNEATAFNRSDIFVGANLLEVGNQRKGRPNEKYRLSIAFKWNTNGYPAFDQTIFYRVIFTVRLNNKISILLLDGHFNFNVEKTFEAGYDIEADNEGNLVAQLHVESYSNLHGDGNININLVLKPISFLTLERKDRTTVVESLD